MKILFTSTILIFGLAFSLAHTTKSYSFVVFEEQTSPLIEVVMAAPVVAQTVPVPVPVVVALSKKVTAVVPKAPAVITLLPKVTVVVPKPVTLAVAPVSVGARLNISSIGVTASIQDMGMTPEGAMAVPDNTVEVGWYSPGTRPGNTGSAVIGAHNRWNNSVGVFSRLEELNTGDIVTVIDAQNVSMSFVVRETRVYNPTDDATEVFTSAGGSHLNLITCSGTWDPTTNTYTKRFVVFTDLQTTEL